MKHITLSLALLIACLQMAAQPYWNINTRIMPLRVPVG